MKERPILFSAPMVRAILDGSKTQTRRIVKPQPEWTEPATAWVFRDDGHSGPGWYAYSDDYPEEGALFYRCPYGRIGERLWVRETWAEVGAMDPGLIVFRADFPACVPSQYENVPAASEIAWKPSIHMFRRHSRINLEITGIRVERLNDISEKDARAEGAKPYLLPVHPAREQLRHVDGYTQLWGQINGAGSWDANPWVWVVEFKRVLP
jgi:hypothetical protein